MWTLDFARTKFRDKSGLTAGGSHILGRRWPYEQLGGNMALQDRMMRAFRGEVALYEEVEKDDNATTEAVIVVALGSLSVGVGQALSQMVTGRPSGGAVGIVVSVIVVLAIFAVFSAVVYFVGTRLFGAEATWNEVLNTLGYAYTHNILGIVRVVPVI